MSVWQVSAFDFEGAETNYGVYSDKAVAERVRDLVNVGAEGDDVTDVGEVEIWDTEPVVVIEWSLSCFLDEGRGLKWEATPHRMVHLEPSEPVPALDIEERHGVLSVRGTDREAVIAAFEERARAAGVLAE